MPALKYFSALVLVLCSLLTAKEQDASKVKENELQAYAEFEESFRSVLELARTQYPKIQAQETQLAQLEEELKKQGIEFVHSPKAKTEGEKLQSLEIEYEDALQDLADHPSHLLAEQYIRISQEYLKVLQNTELLLAYSMAPLLKLEPKELEKEKQKLFEKGNIVEVESLNFDKIEARAELLKSHLFLVPNYTKVEKIESRFRKLIHTGLYFKVFHFDEDAGRDEVTLWDLEWFDQQKKSTRKEIEEALNQIVNIDKLAKDFKKPEHIPADFKLTLVMVPKTAKRALDAIKNIEKDEDIRRALFFQNELEISERKIKAFEGFLTVLNKIEAKEKLDFKDLTKIIKALHAEALYSLVLEQSKEEKDIKASEKSADFYNELWEKMGSFEFYLEPNLEEPVKGTQLEKAMRPKIERALSNKWEDRNPVPAP